MGQSKMVGDGGGQREGLVPDSVPEAKPTLPPCTRLHEPVNASTDTCQMLDVSPLLAVKARRPSNTRRTWWKVHHGPCTYGGAGGGGPVPRVATEGSQQQPLSQKAATKEGSLPNKMTEKIAHLTLCVCQRRTDPLGY